MKTGKTLIPLLLASFLSLGLLSCGGNEDKGDPFQNLTGLCVRQCVLDTGDPSICDTECACASEKMSKELSKDQVDTLIGLLSNNDEGLQTSEAGIKYKKAFSDCDSGAN